ncbi:MAG: hypothetical protein E4H01_13110 [Lysobacterales bacterium]|nr:MAG: hypothetical protein E4H01_13110 [Xanthomonadales bacterium]
MTVNLVPATDIDQFDVGASYEIFRIGTQTVNIAVPASVTVYCRGTPYTAQNIAITKDYVRILLTCVADDVWQMTDSSCCNQYRGTEFTSFASGDTLAVPVYSVTTEAELDAAIAELNIIGAFGGIIIVAGPITFTEDKIWDLTNIIIEGAGAFDTTLCPVPSPMFPSINFGEFEITITSADFTFHEITFVGNINFNLGVQTSQKLFNFCEGDSAQIQRNYIFRNVHFMDVVGSMGIANTPVFDLSGLNFSDAAKTIIGTHSKWVNMEFDGCTQQSEGFNQYGDNSRMAGLVVDAGTCDKDTGIHRFHMLVHSCKEGFVFGRSRWGLRKTNPMGDDDTFGYIFHDDSVQIVEKTNVSTISTRGNKNIQTIPGNYTVEHDHFGSLLICTAGVPYNFSLPTSAYTDAFDAGAQVEVFRSGLGDMSIIIPSGVTLYWRGLAYTIADPPIVITEPYGRMEFTCVGADKWQMTDSWAAAAAMAAVFSANYDGNDVPGTGSNTLVDGKSRIWNKIDSSQSFIVTRVGAQYRLVELTVY